MLSNNGLLTLQRVFSEIDFTDEAVAQYFVGAGNLQINDRK